jgi:endonuclease-3
MTENQQQVLAALKEIYKNIGTALRFHNPYELLVATILSAQSTDKQVNKVTQKLFAKYPDAQAIAALTPEQLAEEIKSIGLYKNKSKNIVAASNMLVEKYNGQVPATMEELVELPGVGRKTANVVLSNAFDVPALAVDTHVFRVANRLKLTDSKDVATSEKQLTALIPREDWSDAHHWLIWHGRLFCKARKPDCHKCQLNQICLSEENTERHQTT